MPRPGSDQADFVDIVTFDKLAATCGEWPPRAGRSPVVVKLRLNEWTSKDGERRSKIQVVADAVQFLGAPNKPGSADEAADKPADRPPLGAYGRKAT